MLRNCLSGSLHLEGMCHYHQVFRFYAFQQQCHIPQHKNSQNGFTLGRLWKSLILNLENCGTKTTWSTWPLRTTDVLNRLDVIILYTPLAFLTFLPTSCRLPHTPSLSPFSPNFSLSNIVISNTYLLALQHFPEPATDCTSMHLHALYFTILKCQQ